MDTLLVVLFVLVLFVIFVGLDNRGLLEKNNSQLIEGIDPTSEDLLQEARLLSSQGVCINPSGDTIWPRDEQSCTGMSGFDLNWVTKENKRTALTNIGTLSDTPIPPDVIEMELTLQYGDIVKIGDREDLYIYRGLEEINLDTHPEEGVGEHIALFPYVNPATDRLEYCYDDNNTLRTEDDITEASACSADPHSGTFFTPVLQPGLILTAVSDDLKSNSCQDDGGGTYLTPGGIECFTKDQIKISHCVESGGQDDPSTSNNIKPRSFWKPRYAIGSNKRINELCEGSPTGNTWNYNSNLNTLMDSQTFAEIASQVDQNVNVQGLNDAATTAFNELQPGGGNTFILPTQQSELLQQQLNARTTMEQADCDFEAEPTRYHGNVGTNTANLYVCTGNIGENDGGIDTVTNVNDNCQRADLSCNTNFAKVDTSVQEPQVVCLNNQFTYGGCEPDTCILPDDFNDKYVITLPTNMIGSGSTPKNAGEPATINDLKDMVTDTSYVSCKNGYNGTPLIRSCSNGFLDISGCDENTCGLPNDITGYHVSQQPTSAESLTTFYANNNMVQPYDTTGNDFRCSEPNYYHLGDIANNPNPDQTFDDFMANVGDTTIQLKDYSMYPKAVCNTDPAVDVANYEFTLSGCQSNQCHNPSLTQNKKIYDGSQKPEHIEDTEDIVMSGNGKYEKYEYNSSLSSTSNTLTVSDIQGTITCGRNYQKEGSIGSTDTHDKVVDADKIRCFNFYDYNSLTDTSNEYSPSYRKKQPDDTLSSEPTDFSDFHTSWLSTNQTDRVLPFSVAGCSENYCTWPTVGGGNQTPYDKPRFRDPTLSGIDQATLDTIQNSNTNTRYQLGYNYDRPTDTNIDYTTRKTAKEYVEYDESDQSVKIKCVGETDQEVCEAEEPYRIDEIDAMITNITANLREKGQNGSLFNTLELSQMGRGGQFTVGRCWHSGVPLTDPQVTCQGSDDCSDPSSSSCEASVSGCQQNKCRISEPDANDGTRVLIEKMDTTGQPIHISVGGIDRENIGESFNVDQIRNITCDFNHSKPIIGGGGGVEDIMIECENDDGTFTITNKCGPTVCTDTIDEIDGLIHLTNHSGDVNTICPNQSWIESHDDFYAGTNQTPSQTDDPLPTIGSNEYCDLSSNTDLFDFNVNRYKLNGGEYECYNDTGIPGDLSGNLSTTKLSSVGVAVNSCNYSPDGSFVPKRAVSGCQPKLCSLPPIANGFNYHPSLTPGDTYSPEGILLREYYSGTAQPSYLSDNDYGMMTFDQDLITCSSGYSGSVNISCGLVDMVITGCNENRCTIPSPLDSSITLTDPSFSQTGTHTVSELLGGITCANNHSVDPGYQISCDTQDGVFTGLDTYCSANTCTVPSSITVHDDTSVDHINRSRVSDPSNIPSDILNILPNTLEQDSALTAEIFGYVAPPSNHNICYHEDIRNIPALGVSLSDISNVSCNEDLCYGNPILVCDTGGHSTDFEISGCEEKYCSLPSLSPTNILYSFGGVRDKLEMVAEMNGLTDTEIGPSPGLTKNQVDRVFSHANKTIDCATFAERDEQTDTSGIPVLDANGVPVLMTPSIECSTNGGEFLLTGCRALQTPSQTHTNGEIVYSYYPSGCSLAKENAFIYLSGTNQFAGVGGTNTTGRSVTHSFDGVEMNPGGETEFYYYKNSADENVSTAEPIHNYSSEPPVLSNGNVWSDTGDATANENWYKVPMVLKYNALSQTQINTNMQAFMDSNKDMCDKISSCEGFNITRFNRLTSEIDAIEKANTRNTDGTVDRTALSEFLAANEFLEFGTMKGEQKDIRCNSQMDVTVVGFHDNWGATTGVGGNSYVYNSAIINNQTQDVLNQNMVPNNSAIYFKKNTLSSPVNNPSMGYTNNDIPNTVVDTSR